MNQNVKIGYIDEARRLRRSRKRQSDPAPISRRGSASTAYRTSNGALVWYKGG